MGEGARTAGFTCFVHGGRTGQIEDDGRICVQCKFIVYAVILVINLMPRRLLAQENWFGVPRAANCRDFQYVSLALADESLRSPVSMFGHTFVVLHNNPVPDPDAMAIEFVGDTSSASMPHIRALFDSISGKFMIRRFVYKLLEYGGEARDIRVWRIGVVPDRCESILESFVARNHQYSFIHKNCAWHAARLASGLISGRSASEVYSGQAAMTDAIPVTIPIRTLDGFIPADVGEDFAFPSMRRRAATALGQLPRRQSDQLVRRIRGDDPHNDIEDGQSREDRLIASTMDVVGGVLLHDEADATVRQKIFLNKKKIASQRPQEASIYWTGVSLHKPRRRTASIGAAVFKPVGSGPGLRLTGQLGMRHVMMPQNGNPDPGELKVFDFSVRHMVGGTFLDRLGLVKLDASLPDSILVPGFTRLIDLAYESHRTSRGVEIQNEAGLRIGGGMSFKWRPLVASVSLVGTFRYIRFPVPSSHGTAYDGGFTPRASLRLRAFAAVSDNSRINLVGEYFTPDRRPLVGTLEAFYAHDLDAARFGPTAVNIGFRGMTFRDTIRQDRQRWDGAWEWGLVRSL